MKEELSRVEIFIKEEKLDTLVNALIRYGVQGMTVNHVLGFGMQKGVPEYEMGLNKPPVLRNCEQVTLFLSNEKLDKFTKFVMEELYTGHIGDGKIFISDVKKVIKVRTGDENLDAI